MSKNTHNSNYPYTYGDLVSPEKAAQNRREFLRNKKVRVMAFAILLSAIPNNILISENTQTMINEKSFTHLIINRSVFWLILVRWIGKAVKETPKACLEIGLGIICGAAKVVGVNIFTQDLIVH